MIIVDTDLANDDIASIIMMRNDPNFKYISLCDGVLNVQQAMEIIKPLLYMMERPDIKVILSNNIDPDPKIERNKFPQQLNEGIFEHIKLYFDNVDVPDTFEIKIVHNLSSTVHKIQTRALKRNKERPKPLDIIVLGSFENIATLKNKTLYPVCLFIGAGALFSDGNVFEIDPETDQVSTECVNTQAEWNIYFDISGAQVVFNDTRDFYRYVLPLDTTEWISINEFIPLLCDTIDTIENKVHEKEEKKEEQRYPIIPGKNSSDDDNEVKGLDFLNLMAHLFQAYFEADDVTDDIYLYDEMVILYYYYPRLFMYRMEQTRLKITDEGTMLICNHDIEAPLQSELSCNTCVGGDRDGKFKGNVTYRNNHLRTLFDHKSECIRDFERNNSTDSNTIVLRPKKELCIEKILSMLLEG
jgi:inosine-uridine nucleoside N-ribohydrolase